ncbi:MAG TPA: ABC transporter permease [Gammaproteobacteria bacterium]
MHTLLFEVRHAGRRLARSPGFFFITVLMLSLGTGLTLFSFGGIQAYLLSEPPYPKPQQLAHIELYDPASGEDGIEVPQPLYLRWEKQSLPGALAGFYLGTVNMSGEERPERFEGAFVTTGMFGLLQTQPAKGRDFTSADSIPGAPAVIIISHDLWLNRFLGAPDVVGRTIRVNAHPATIIGVMPEHFAFPMQQDVWLPITHDPNVDYDDAIDLEVIARLADGRGVGGMHDALAAALAHMESELPAELRHLTPAVKTYAEEFVSDWAQRVVATLSVCVLFVLFIACVNVASLMTARGIRYQRETAIRGALGASRWRLVASVLCESLLVSIAAGGVGLLLSHWGGDALDRYLAATDDLPPYWVTAPYDWNLLMFIAGLVFLVAMVAGLAPALRAGRTDLAHDLKEGGGTSGGRASRTIRVLVSVEIALSCILLVSTGLMLRSTANAMDVDIGADTENVLTGRVGMFDDAYPNASSRRLFVERLQDELSRIPGVTAATVATGLPGAVSGSANVRPEGVEKPAEVFEGNWTRYVAVTPEYFELFDIALREGRFLAALDDAQHPDTAVVTQAFADEYLPGENALGKRIWIEHEERWVTIVGVTRNVIQDEDDLNEPPQPVLYRPVAQTDYRFFSFAIKAAGDPYLLQNPVRAAVQRVDADMPVYWLRTLDDWILIGTSGQHLLSALLGVCTFFAVLLAGIGLYAVMAYAVNQRVREIGVRRALGADDARVMALLFRDNAMQLSVALLAGLVLAVGFARLFASEFVGVSSFDPLTYLAVIVMLVFMIVIASFVPTRRALKIQPQEALRHE